MQWRHARLSIVDILGGYVIIDDAMFLKRCLLV